MKTGPDFVKQPGNVGRATGCAVARQMVDQYCPWVQPSAAREVAARAVAPVSGRPDPAGSANATGPDTHRIADVRLHRPASGVRASTRCPDRHGRSRRPTHTSSVAPDLHDQSGQHKASCLAVAGAVRDHSWDKGRRGTVTCESACNRETPCPIPLLAAVAAAMDCATAILRGPPAGGAGR